jgi:hypothetical protein
MSDRFMYLALYAQLRNAQGYESARMAAPHERI